MWRKILLVLFVIAVVLGVVVRRFPVNFLFFEENKAVEIENTLPQEIKIQPVAVPEEKVGVEQEQSAQGGFASGEKKVPQSSFIENVPFTAQAPFGEWSISTFQNGCEEASVVMAAYWALEKPLTKEIAKKEIIALAEFEDKKHGQSIDTSAKDTEKLFKEYYSIITTEVRTDIAMVDIQETLATGAVVIVPADGRKLKNPNFKQPGPTTHMVVVIGYDAQMREFITNDSGTRNGKGYRYEEEVFYGAIRDYPTGNHLPIVGIHKDMIVVKKRLAL